MTQTPPNSPDLRRTAVLPDLPREVHVSDPTSVRVWEDLIRRRRVYVVGDVNEEQAEETIRALHWVDDQRKAPISIYISSLGGEVPAGLAMFDAIRALKSPTTTIGLGWVASMAGILLQAGQTRLIGPRSWLMIHEISTLIEGKASDIADEAQLLKRIQQQVLDVLAERSKMNRKEIEDKWTRKDWWMSSHEAIKQGFVDRLFTPPKPRQRADQ